MRFKLGKDNIDRIKKVLQKARVKSVIINHAALIGVVSIDITEANYDLCQGKRFDGRKQDIIILKFNFIKGYVVYTFSPNTMTCLLTFDSDVLLITIKHLEEHKKEEILELKNKPKQYEEFASKKECTGSEEYSEIEYKAFEHYLKSIGYYDE